MKKNKIDLIDRMPYIWPYAKPIGKAYADGKIKWAGFIFLIVFIVVTCTAAILHYNSPTDQFTFNGNTYVKGGYTAEVPFGYEAYGIIENGKGDIGAFAKDDEIAGHELYIRYINNELQKYMYVKTADGTFDSFALQATNEYPYLAVPIILIVGIAAGFGVMYLIKQRERKYYLGK